VPTAAKRSSTPTRLNYKFTPRPTTRSYGPRKSAGQKISLLPLKRAQVENGVYGWLEESGLIAIMAIEEIY